MWYTNKLGTSWSSPAELQAGSGDCSNRLTFGHHPNLQIDGNNKVHIISTNYQGKIFYGTNASGSWVHSQLNGNATGSVRAHSFHINSNNDKIVAYKSNLGSSAGNLKYVYQRGGTSIWTIGTIFAVGGFTGVAGPPYSVTIADDRTAMAMIDAYNGSCSSGNPRKLYSAVTSFDCIGIEPNLETAALCKDITVTLDASGQVQINPYKGINAGSATFCPNEQLAISQEVFTCADIGQNTVTLSYIFNSVAMDNCTATVTVQDQAGPTAQCQSFTMALDATGTAALSAADLDAGSSELCGNISSMKLWDSSVGPDQEKQFNLTINFDPFPEETSWTVTSGGTTYASSEGAYSASYSSGTITEVFSLEPGCYELNFYDSSGNGICCNSGVEKAYILKDEENNIIALGADEFDYQESINFCVTEDLFIDDILFDCSDPGTKPVLLLLKDNYGNGAICESIISVVDNETPIISNCPESAVYTNLPGQCGAIVDFLTPSVIDNCDGVTLELSQGINNQGFFPGRNNHTNFCCNRWFRQYQSMFF